MNNTCCALCGATDSKLFRCSQCKIVCYCSKDHQRQDWKKGHRSKCSLYQGDIKRDNAIAGTSRTIIASLNSDSNRRTYVETHGKRNGSGVNFWDAGLFTAEGSSENEILNARIETLRTDFDYEADALESREDLRGFAEISLDELDKGNILEVCFLNFYNFILFWVFF